MSKDCGCEKKSLCEICIKNHKGLLFGYSMSLATLASIPLALNMKTYDSKGNLIKEETKPLEEEDAS